ncbi:MAG: type II secretion system protein [Clostridia bacterium]|nr:type II secretion system protein [Clostridia bacterium]
MKKIVIGYKNHHAEDVKNKKGFTLVELIVVLVILAILAAMLVPALTGYIDKAREKKIISNGRLSLVAAQTLASERYGSSQPEEELTMADVDAFSEAPGNVTAMTIDDGAVQSTEENPFEYTEDGMTAVYKAGVWSIKDGNGSGGGESGGGEGEAADPKYGTAVQPAGKNLLGQPQNIQDFFNNGWYTLDTRKGQITYKMFESGGEQHFVVWHQDSVGSDDLKVKLEEIYGSDKVDKNNIYRKKYGEDFSKGDLQEALSGALGLESFGNILVDKNAKDSLVITGVTGIE